MTTEYCTIVWMRRRTKTWRWIVYEPPSRHTPRVQCNTLVWPPEILQQLEADKSCDVYTYGFSQSAFCYLCCLRPCSSLCFGAKKRHLWLWLSVWNHVQSVNCKLRRYVNIARVWRSRCNRQIIKALAVRGVTEILVPVTYTSYVSTGTFCFNIFMCNCERMKVDLCKTVLGRTSAKEIIRLLQKEKSVKQWTRS
jgi:hypothetical protein